MYCERQLYDKTEAMFLISCVWDYREMGDWITWKEGVVQVKSQCLDGIVSLALLTNRAMLFVAIYAAVS